MGCVCPGLFGVYVECDPAVGEKVARAIPALVKDLGVSLIPFSSRD